MQEIHSVSGTIMHASSRNLPPKTVSRTTTVQFVGVHVLVNGETGVRDLALTPETLPDALGGRAIYAQVALTCNAHR